MSLPILVTGAAGFVGARFLSDCNRRDQPVVSCDAARHFTSRGEHAGIRWGEVVDREALFDWLEKEKRPLRGIVHLGACTDTTELDVGLLTKVNLEYSQRLWRTAAERGLPFVYASSAATYGDGSHGYLDEESRLDELVPLNPYGKSKHDFDRWALAEEKADRRPPAWSAFKFFNVYGFGERHKGKMASVVLHAFDQIRASGKVRLFKSYRADIADGRQTRDFVFVDDVVSVLRFALEKPLSRGIYNLGSGEPRSYLDLARATFRALGVPENVGFIDMPEGLRERYQYYTRAEITKLRRAGYDAPFTKLEDGVARYVAELKARAA